MTSRELDTSARQKLQRELALLKEHARAGFEESYPDRQFSNPNIARICKVEDEDGVYGRMYLAKRIHDWTKKDDPGLPGDFRQLLILVTVLNRWAPSDKIRSRDHWKALWDAAQPRKGRARAMVQGADPDNPGRHGSAPNSDPEQAAPAPLPGSSLGSVDVDVDNMPTASPVENFNQPLIVREPPPSERRTWRPSMAWLSCGAALLLVLEALTMPWWWPRLRSDRAVTETRSRAVSDQVQFRVVADGENPNDPCGATQKVPDTALTFKVCVHHSAAGTGYGIVHLVNRGEDDLYFRLVLDDVATSPGDVENPQTRYSWRQAWWIKGNVEGTAEQFLLSGRNLSTEAFCSGARAYIEYRGVTTKPSVTPLVLGDGIECSSASVGLVP